ncbi:MAG TPA: efflux transporter outer membrane subunit [Polyangiaceae bacterium]|nr:efflux transporter outer membrane subunit [Polyangiaceae bacterium]
MSRCRLAVATLAAVAAATLGCTLEPRYRRPKAPIAREFPSGGAYGERNPTELAAVRYVDVFRDPNLRAVIASALANSRDLRVAAANVLSARAQYRAARAGLFPRVDANAGVLIGGGAPSSAAGTGAATNAASPSADDIYHVYSANLALTSFELDLFGRVRSSSNAALEAYFATQAGARAARLSLVSEVALQYLTLATDRSQLAIAKETLQNAGTSAELARARLRGGIAALLDLRQAETVVLQARASIAQRTTAVEQDLNALDLLAGAPVDRARLPRDLASVAALVVELPAGVRSEVLLRRPDVMQAEFLLRSANARIGAARAAFFPTISLTGLLGFASTSLTNLFTSDAFGWNVRPTASVNLFNGGANQANLEYSWAQRALYLAEYERAIQRAFREVADALARQGTIAEQLAAEREVVSVAEDSYRLAEARYRGGVESFLATLEAQRTLFAARQSLVQTELVRAQTLVSLYRALGADSFE